MLVALFLIIAATLNRVLPPLLHVHHDWMGNFSPLASLVLCGAIFFPRSIATWVPFLILLISDLILNLVVYQFPLLTWDILPRYVVFAVIGALGYRYRQWLHAKPFALLSTSFAASLLYFLATNSASWLGEAGYAKNLTGWWQAMTVGLPGYPPTWVFFRNSALSDLLFTSLFIISMAATRTKKSAAKPAHPTVAVATTH